MYLLVSSPLFEGHFPPCTACFSPFIVLKVYYRHHCIISFLSEMLHILYTVCKYVCQRCLQSSKLTRLNFIPSRTKIYGLNGHFMFPLPSQDEERCDVWKLCTRSY
ncbi:hypothetical protein FKM82_012747 [Ascaphus truei]